jgi:hypothetical protein
LNPSDKEKTNRDFASHADDILHELSSSSKQQAGAATSPP